MYSIHPIIYSFYLYWVVFVQLTSLFGGEKDYIREYTTPHCCTNCTLLYSIDLEQSKGGSEIILLL